MEELPEFGIVKLLLEKLTGGLALKSSATPEPKTHFLVWFCAENWKINEKMKKIQKLVVVLMGIKLNLDLGYRKVINIRQGS
jgi:hypothetical protein